MFFNFWRISAYFRRSCFCSRRLSVFEHGAKIQSDFCPTLFLLIFFKLQKTPKGSRKTATFWRFFENFQCSTLVIPKRGTFIY
ncbi:hypothetical protein DVY35_00620 [Enterococcus faecalis]|nr:hypothetical protein [Enterococcus faecalis]TKO64768.1 hypothetical protein DVY43_00625 [Enterococcus faecalis]TKO77434.1 hypothetical protein DVY36_00715 [Enterococcus faecalis]TKP07797.1 hypothetical protein DVY35_00620 [Enterococcus faecalis]